ncbi:MAG: hypothetical protein ATN34_00920 [Epulopiscium sp. Nele67-Bin002]|nr:MAG: hypothetical protein BEN18_00860 [Epulopiscium sp. Nuni2H_MBin001]OON91428.1 MAG: hypothetical protein ATN34_00920 [Epulopiscium sp. Nele67-Bin002]OON94541.1 MAG: hypothetical protein ATN33_04275 [Epulopiscium sp. Nele67-Bin001]
MIAGLISIAICIGIIYFFLSLGDKVNRTLNLSHSQYSTINNLKEEIERLSNQVNQLESILINQTLKNEELKQLINDN